MHSLYLRRGVSKEGISTSSRSSRWIRGCVRPDTATLWKTSLTFRNDMVDWVIYREGLLITPVKEGISSPDRVTRNFGLVPRTLDTRKMVWFVLYTVDDYMSSTTYTLLASTLRCRRQYCPHFRWNCSGMKGRLGIQINRPSNPVWDVSRKLWQDRDSHWDSSST